MKSNNKLSRWTLLLDGVVLALAGGAAIISETIGHFFGVGPMAAAFGSPYTIGGFEAHGLAVLIGALLLRASRLGDRTLWHAVGLITHFFLGSANILFWFSYEQQNMVLAGYVTTILHGIFVVAQGICLRAELGTRR